MLLDGAPVRFDSPEDARARGVETVYQNLALATTLGPAANIFLGREIVRPGLLGRLGFLDHRALLNSVSPGGWTRGLFMQVLHYMSASSRQVRD